MKITKIVASLIEIPAKQEVEYTWMPGSPSKSIKFTLVRVYTDEGIVGIGASHEARDVVAIATIRSWVTPYLIGKDPTSLEPLGEILDFARPFGSVPWLVSQALCDIVGKVANQPLYRLWGGSRDKILAYAAPCKKRSPEETADLALELREMGYRAIKLRLHNPTIQEDIDLVEATRIAVGDSMQIMVDANQAVLLNVKGQHPRWDYRRALATARELERLNVYYLEEPLYLYDFDGIARLTDQTSIYIAGGEWNVGVHEFKWMMEKGAYDIYQPDVTQTTGPWESLKVGLMAEANGKICIPHTWGNGIGLAGNLQVALALPNCPYFEYPFDPEVYPIAHNQGMVLEPLLVDNEGYIRPNDKPGTGVELDEEVIERYTIATTDSF
jgi:L-alanine-DL-glutamate epimerase-like enolase superfamily enzyme